MHYDDGAFYRPLFENNMLQLQVARGCSHNRCKFCDMYHEPFAISPREEVLADLDEAADYFGEAGCETIERVFLTGGNAFCLPQRELVWVLEAIVERFPRASVGCFARVTDIARKGDDDLAELARRGVGDISIGTESGLDEALATMDKGFSATDSLGQCRRLDEAGLTYDLFYLLGMAGHGAATASAEATAELYSKLHPQRVMVHTMTAFAGTELRDMIDAGKFVPAGELETITELRRFVELFEPENEVYLLGNHYGNAAHPCAWLPSRRREVLEYLDGLLATQDEDALEHRRAQMTSI